MPAASIIFWTIFVVPFVAFLIWLMRQDKNKKTSRAGLIVLAIMVVGVIVYMYIMTKGQ